MFEDALSQALSERRGRGFDSGLLTVGSEPPQIEEAPPVPPPPAAAKKEVSPKEKLEEALEADAPESDQSLEDEMRDEIMDHMSKEEFERLKDIKPRSLAERAQLEAARKFYKDEK